MKMFLAVASIFFLLFVAGESLVCQDCVNLNGTNCFGNLTTCDANSTSCENGIMEMTEGGNTTFIAFKACARFPQCHSYFFSGSVGDDQYQMQKNCCTTDNCNADPIVLPPRNNTPNGVECPFCFAENTTTCQSKAKMRCTGVETKCVDLAGKMHPFDEVGTFAVRQCMSKEPCDQKWLSWPDAPVLDVTRFSCHSDDNDDDRHHRHDDDKNDD